MKDNYIIRINAGTKAISDGKLALISNLLFILSEVNSINMGAIDRFHITSIVIYSDRSGSIDTSDCDPVTRHNTVNQFPITEISFSFDDTQDSWTYA